MSLFVVHDNRIVARGTTGVRRNDATTPTTMTDQWHIGSDTKSMTAVLIGWMVKNSYFPKDWDTTLSDVFSDMTITPALQGVTLIQLLSHHSGLRTDSTADGTQYWTVFDNAGGNVVQARDNLTRIVLSQPPPYPVGSYHYSNLGFIIAGHMAERQMQRVGPKNGCTGPMWEDMMRTCVFGPLQMTQAGFGPPGTVGVIDQPRGHDSNLNPIEPTPRGSDNAPTLGPAGRVHLSMSDWATYVNMFLKGARGETDSVMNISKEYMENIPFDDLLTDRGNQIAMGWGVGNNNGMPLLMHYGSNGYWTAFAYVDVADDVAVVIVINRPHDQFSMYALWKATYAVVCQLPDVGDACGTAKSYGSWAGIAP